MGLPVTFSYSSSILSRKTVDTSDNALMSAVGAGTVSKLAVLFERHHRALYRYFISMTRDPQVSEDLMQDVFFRILRYPLFYYDPRHSFTAWMYQIAKNANMDWIRQKRGRWSRSTNQTMKMRPVSPDLDPETSAVRAQDVKRVSSSIWKLLPPEKRFWCLPVLGNEVRRDCRSAWLWCRHRESSSVSSDARAGRNLFHLWREKKKHMTCDEAKALPMTGAECCGRRNGPAKAPLGGLCRVPSGSRRVGESLDEARFPARRRPVSAVARQILRGLGCLW